MTALRIWDEDFGGDVDMQIERVQLGLAHRQVQVVEQERTYRIQEPDGTTIEIYEQTRIWTEDTDYENH